MDEVRFGRLEEKVDKIKDDMHDVKYEVIEMSKDVKSYIKSVTEHVESDNKIINKIEPLLNELPSIVSMVKSYEVDKEILERTRLVRTEKRAKITDYGKKVGIISVVIGIVTSVAKAFF